MTATNCATSSRATAPPGMGNAGRVVSLLDGREEIIPANALVFASANHTEDSLARELEVRGITFAAIGDCIAARQAPYAVHEGRKIALGL